MRPRPLLLLSLAVLVLASFIFFFEQDQPSTGERREEAKKVLHFAADSVTELVIEIGTERTVLRRESIEGKASGVGAWRIAEPFQARANGGEVKALLDRLGELEKERTVTGFSRQDLGLSPPRASVRLLAAGVESVLEVGAEVPATASMMVALAGQDEAYRIDASLFEELSRTPGDWRDPTLFPWPSNAIDRLIVTLQGEQLTLSRRQEDLWIEGGATGLPPEGDLADRNLANGLLNALGNLRAESFIDTAPPLAEIGLAPAWAILEVYRAGVTEPLRIELALGDDSAPTASAHATVDGQLVMLNDGLRLALQAPEGFPSLAAGWRSMAWSQAQVFQVETLSLAWGQETLSLNRIEGQWLRDGKEIAFATVSEFLQAVIDTHGAHFLDLPTATGDILLRINLHLGEGLDERLTLYRLGDGQYAIDSADRNALMSLDATQAMALLDRAKALGEATPITKEQEERQNVELDNEDHNEKG